MHSRSIETTAVLDGLRRIVRVLRESSREAEATLGVSGAQLFALKALSEAPQLSLSELAERTRTHQSSVSVVVKRLVSSRLVARKASPLDGRQLQLSLTARGRTVLQRAPHAAQDRLILAVEALPRPERKALGRSLARLAEAMGARDAVPQMFFEEQRRGA